MDTIIDLPVLSKWACIAGICSVALFTDGSMLSAHAMQCSELSDSGRLHARIQTIIDQYDDNDRYDNMEEIKELLRREGQVGRAVVRYFEIIEAKRKIDDIRVTQIRNLDSDVIDGYIVNNIIMYILRLNSKENKEEFNNQYEKFLKLNKKYCFYKEESWIYFYLNYLNSLHNSEGFYRNNEIVESLRNVVLRLEFDSVKHKYFEFLEKSKTFTFNKEVEHWNGLLNRRICPRKTSMRNCIQSLRGLVFNSEFPKYEVSRKQWSCVLQIVYGDRLLSFNLCE